MRLRQVLKEELARQRLSEREVSLGLGRDHAFINKVLRGERCLDFAELVEIAHRLGLAPDDLVRRSTD